MKKLWTKFKHWLIKKLGGYTEQFTHKTEAVYIPAYSMPVTLQTCVKADAMVWHDDRYMENYRRRTMDALRDKLMDELWEHADEGLVDIKHCDNLEEDTITIQATVRLYKFN